MKSDFVNKIHFLLSWNRNAHSLYQSSDSRSIFYLNSIQRTSSAYKSIHEKVPGSICFGKTVAPLHQTIEWSYHIFWIACYVYDLQIKQAFSCSTAIHYSSPWIIQFLLFSTKKIFLSKRKTDIPVPCLAVAAPVVRTEASGIWSFEEKTFLLWTLYLADRMIKLKLRCR